MRRRAFACTWRRAKGRRATSPRRSSTCCFPRAPRHASRLRPSPAPTARPRRRACWRTSRRWAAITPGLTTTDGVYIDGQRTVQGDMTGPVSARMVLADPQIDIAVLETARGGLLRAGMGVNEVNVGAVLNVQADHLGLKGIDTLEQLGELKRIVVEVATDCAVLNADDPLVLKMAALHRGEEHLLRDHESAPHAGARAHPRGRARLRARGRRQRPDDDAVRSRRPHSAALDPPDSGDARGPGDAQRAERDVRRRHGLLAGA